MLTICSTQQKFSIGEVARSMASDYGKVREECETLTLNENSFYSSDYNGVWGFVSFLR